jgi:hypothetical protein
MIYGKKGSEIKRFASDDSAAPSSRMVSSAITLIRSSMCSASASVFGFLASIYRAIVFRASPVAPNSGHDRFSSSGGLAKVAAALRSLVNL